MTICQLPLDTDLPSTSNWYIYRTYTTIYITPLSGGFPSSISRLPRGYANPERHVFGFSLWDVSNDDLFGTDSIAAEVMPTMGRSAQRDVMYTVVTGVLVGPVAWTKLSSCQLYMARYKFVGTFSCVQIDFAESARSWARSIYSMETYGQWESWTLRVINTQAHTGGEEGRHLRPLLCSLFIEKMESKSETICTRSMPQRCFSCASFGFRVLSFPFALGRILFSMIPYVLQ